MRRPYLDKIAQKIASLAPATKAIFGITTPMMCDKAVDDVVMSNNKLAVALMVCQLPPTSVLASYLLLSKFLIVTISPPYSYLHPPFVRSLLPSTCPSVPPVYICGSYIVLCMGVNVYDIVCAHNVLVLARSACDTAPRDCRRALPSPPLP